MNPAGSALVLQRNAMCELFLEPTLGFARVKIDEVSDDRRVCRVSAFLGSYGVDGEPEMPFTVPSENLFSLGAHGGKFRYRLLERVEVSEGSLWLFATVWQWYPQYGFVDVRMKWNGSFKRVSVMEVRDLRRNINLPPPPPPPPPLVVE